jgi:hypothetical protein
MRAQTVEPAVMGGVRGLHAGSRPLKGLLRLYGTPLKGGIV